MRLLIQTQGLLLSRQDRDEIRTRIHNAFARFGHKTLGASLHLQDINGPRGGQDKNCHLVVELEDTTAVITDRGSDLKSVVNRAVHRAVQTLRRQLQHQQMSTRQAVSLRHASNDKPLSRRQKRSFGSMETGDA
jgi:putative sigma-54 modulation protein